VAPFAKVSNLKEKSQNQEDGVGSLIASKQLAMKSEKAQDLGERTFLFACDIVRYCRKLSREPGVTRQLSWQLADAGSSIAANYEEAKGSYSRREFAAKNAIVLKEAREARLWLRLILACDLASDGETRALYDEANELVGIFTASVQKLRAPQIFVKALVSVTLAFLVLTFLF
jgi:four helix bundle protein